MPPCARRRAPCSAIRKYALDEWKQSSRPTDIGRRRHSPGHQLDERPRSTKGPGNAAGSIYNLAAHLAEFLLSKGYIVHGIKRRSSFNTERVDHLMHDPHEEGVAFQLHYGDVTGDQRHPMLTLLC